ncbi:hypothetical protein Gpo141_00007599 [Globisporangium polare]
MDSSKMAAANEQHAHMAAAGGGTSSSGGAQQHQQEHHEEDDDVEIGNDYDAFPHSEECTAVLTMKCGEPLMAVRKKLHDDILITFIPEEGFGVFQCKVERHYSKIDAAYVQEKRGIYLKPSSNATQTKYVLLTKENFEPLLRMRWKIARSMKVELKYEIFCYFVDTTNKKEKKRLSMKMFGEGHQNHSELNGGAAAAASVGPSFLSLPPSGGSSGGGVHGFPVMSAQAISQAIQNYADMNASIIDANLPGVTSKRASGSRNGGGKDDSTGGEQRPRKIARISSRSSNVAVPAVSASEQLAADLHEEPFFQPIPFRINGFVVPLEVDITALRRALGLSGMVQSLTSSSNAAVDAPAPSVDVGDAQQQQHYDR